MSTQGLVRLLKRAQCNVAASSNFDGLHTPSNIYPDYENEYNSSVAWVPETSDTNQHLVIGCETPKSFVAISIQGDKGEQWVKSYKIRYSLDNITFTDYNGGNNGVINGCNNSSTVETHFFDTIIRARCITIHPLTWSTGIALRVELFTKPNLSSFTQIGQVSSDGSTNLTNGSGEREIRKSVKFNVPFSSKPVVGLCFDTISSQPDKNGFTLVFVKPDNITTDGFDCVFITWSDAKVTTLRADYIATCNE